MISQENVNVPAIQTDTAPIRGRGVTAAQQIFTLHGGGSNPSGLIDLNYRLVAQWSEQAPYKGQTMVRLHPGLLKTETWDRGVSGSIPGS